MNDGSLLDRVWPWCAHLLARHDRPMILGINGPQGCGKSTLAAAVVACAQAEGHSAVTLSTDDFYLTHASQRALATAHPEEPLLAVRGGPGTHDIGLGTATIAALRGLNGEVRLPRYDKSAFGGQGDRAPEGTWPVVQLPVGLVVFEGWTLGFPPLLPPRNPRLAGVDARLPEYRSWTEALSALVQLRTALPETIVRWRLEAESERRARNPEGALPEREARAYISRFLPFYEEYPDALERDPRVTAHRVFHLGPDRRPRD